jgi:co-chaperonin GroES (HSP10)
MSNLAVPHHTVSALAQYQTPEEFKNHIMTALKEKLEDVDVMFNSILLAIYIRPEKTKGGIIRPDSNVSEDVWQGKAGLVLKLGPNAFEDDGEYNFHGQKIAVGEWVVFKVGDAWSLNIGDIACRLVRDSNIRLKVKNPAIVF